MSSTRRLPTHPLIAPLTLAALILSACAGSSPESGKATAPAAAGSGTVDEARLQRFFALMDQDGNGSISRPEFQTGKGMVFMAIDADESLALTQNEMRLTPEAFNLLAGGDGMVDGEEFIAGKIASFDAIDQNQDHEIPYAELRDYLAKYE